MKASTGMTRSLLLFLMAAASSVLSFSQFPQHLVKKDSLDSTPDGWDMQSEVPHPDHPITLQIALKQHNFSSLVEHLYQVSDPDHDRYGQYLTKEEVENLVRPHVASLEAVDDWLHSHAVDLATVIRSPAKDWLIITVPVSLAETLIGSRYSTFRHRRSGKLVVRSLEYSLPVSVIDHVDFIQPTTFFGSSSLSSFNPRSVRRTKALTSRSSDTNTTSPCDLDPAIGMTPACLMHLYRFDKYTPRAISKNKLGVAVYLGDFLINKDLQQFFQSFRPDAINSTFSVQSVAGGGISTNYTAAEAALDIEYAMSLTYPTPVTVYSVGATTENGDNEGFLTWAQFVLNQTNPPQVFTTSYADTESSIPLDYATRMCNTFAQLGARGISVIFGSGDSGVDNDVICGTISNSTRFEPSFPGGCPYLTSVGGTAGINPEIGVGGPLSSANYRGSGSGFSNYFPRPQYQINAVSAYLKGLGSTYKGLYNSTGRAFPDISAQSNSFAIVDNDIMEVDSGTSASGPLVAAIISLLNDYRISNGKPALGFLNPWLYSKGYQGLNDILLGQSEGCNGRGFNASKGWDPVTGLGTPDFLKLQKLVF